MSEMIERVAKAIFADRYPGEDWKDYQKRDYCGHARAAIEAMREPNKQMLQAMYREDWDGIIDAALSEKPQHITVACKCGWQGCQSKLNGNYCPTCAAPFKAWP